MFHAGFELFATNPEDMKRKRSNWFIKLRLWLWGAAWSSLDHFFFIGFLDLKNLLCYKESKTILFIVSSIYFWHKVNYNFQYGKPQTVAWIVHIFQKRGVKTQMWSFALWAWTRLGWKINSKLNKLYFLPKHNFTSKICWRCWNWANAKNAKNVSFKSKNSKTLAKMI